VLYLYALSEHPAAVPPVLGLDDTPVAVERLDAVDALIGVVEGERVEPSEAAILAHARVVDAVTAANDAVLPARFGRGYSDLDALRTAITARSAELDAALARVRGCLELGLRVMAPRDETRGRDGRGSGSGSDYMRARLEERRQAERVADEVHTPLAELARAATRSVGATPELLLSAAYLVPRGAVEYFRARLAELGDDHPDLTLACTGPWPPYSFATTEAAPQ
jgi:hypothetical protein